VRRSIEIEVSLGIKAAPEAIWPHLVNWEHLDRWMKEATNIRVLSPQREGVGVVCEANIRIGFIRTVDRIRVSRWAPPHVLGLEHLGWVKGDGLMESSLENGKTRLRWTETFTPPLGWIGALGMRVWKPLMRRVFARDLRLLQIIVEGDGPG
jgi:polyketide cyclase/dehydrase/lipid transport protein